MAILATAIGSLQINCQLESPVTVQGGDATPGIYYLQQSTSMNLPLSLSSPIPLRSQLVMHNICRQ